MRFLCLYFVILGIAVVKAVVYFEDKFQDDSWEKNWIYSEHPGKEFGKFVRYRKKLCNGLESEEGIQTSKNASFYALSRKFTPFSNKGKNLVVQFSVKHEQNIDCGGGYVKVFDCSLNQTDMHGDSPYLLMFGPDICGPGTKKVHVIFKYGDKNVLIKKDIRCKDDVHTHLYTLIVKPDNKYEVLIDNEKVESGELEEDWDFLPPKKIKDPNQSKPEDWDDRVTIPDPNHKKPEDWEKPEHIQDPEATKPDDWDEEMDGEWEPPMINNPEYQGEWKPKQIDNPDYKGLWVHPEIDNPEYEANAELYKLDEICTLGFDLWQVKSGTVFSNILITDDIDHARKVGEEDWRTTYDCEVKRSQEEEKNRAKEKEAEDSADSKDDEDEDEDEDKEDEKENEVLEAEEHDEL